MIKFTEVDATEIMMIGMISFVVGLMGWMLSAMAITDIGSDYPLFPNISPFALKVIHILSMITMIISLIVLCANGIILLISMVNKNEG